MSDGYVGPDPKTTRHETGNAMLPSPKSFPYYPPVLSEEELKRVEVMIELNKWANNDPFMAKRAAETLILLLAEQFNINLLALNP